MRESTHYTYAMYILHMYAQKDPVGKSIFLPIDTTWIIVSSNISLIDVRLGKKPTPIAQCFFLKCLFLIFSYTVILPAWNLFIKVGRKAWRNFCNTVMQAHADEQSTGRDGKIRTG